MTPSESASDAAIAREPIAAASLVCRRAAAGDAARIDAFALETTRASFFHGAGWTRAVCEEFGHEDHSLLAERDGEVVGVMPLALCRGLRGGRALISTPYGVYGGPIGVDLGAERALFEEAERLALALGVGRLEMRCQEDLGFGLPEAELHATFVKELGDDPAGVLPAMPKKARADARKARNTHGLQLHEGRWYLPDLIRLFHLNKRALGSPALPASYFARLLETFGDRATIHVVKKDGETLAAVMSFLFRDQVLAYHSGTAEGVDRAFKASGFMYMALQEWSIENGYRIFDFGRSRKDSGAFSFKQHQGFQARDLHYAFRLVRDKGLPTFNPSNPRTKILQQTWSKLPLGVTQLLSKPASRFLP